MARYRVSGTTAATAATDQHAICALWNPHATKSIICREISVVAFAAPGAGAGFLVRRISVRGTAGSTVTPGAVNETDEDPGTNPLSGYLLDLAAYSVQPTLVAGDLDAWVFAAVAASGIVKPYPEGIYIGPGRGLVLVNRAAIIFPTSEVSFLTEE
jgi:hypothetical protein